MGWPLKYLKNFAPFKIDALGLVTLLGAEEVNNSVGRLVRSRWLEHLPLLGAYVFASDAFADKQPGFQFYNVSSGIFTPDLSGWFTRWMMAQNFHLTCSKVTWTIEDTRTSKVDSLKAATISIVLNSGFIALTVLMKDWWGFVNALSMAASIIVRFVLVSQRRAGLDRAAENAHKDKNQNIVKIIVILSDSKAVYMCAPESLVKTCFTATPKPPNEPLYEFFKWVGWLAFGGHIISLGMSLLVTQLITIVLIIGPTIAIVWRFGCEEEYIGSRLKAVRRDWDDRADEPGRRIDLYAYLQLNEEEELSLKKWDITPHERSVTRGWWATYQIKKENFNAVTDSFNRDEIKQKRKEYDEEQARLAEQARLLLQAQEQKNVQSAGHSVTSSASSRSGASGTVQQVASFTDGTVVHVPNKVP